MMGNNNDAVASETSDSIITTDSSMVGSETTTLNSNPFYVDDDFDLERPHGHQNAAPQTTPARPSSGLGQTYDDSPTVHDQLPSVEEYKVKIGNIGVIDPMMEKPRKQSSTSNRLIVNVQEDEDGVDDEVVHDQLPSVEEIKMSAGHDGAVGKSPYRRMLGICMFLVSLLMVLVIPPVVVLTSRKKGTSASVATLQNREERLRLVQDYLIANLVASEKDIVTVGTPQYWASNWIAHQDDMQMAIPKDCDSIHNPFIERYSLAVIYYSTGGPAWNYQLNFLSSKDVCEWYSEFRADGSDDIVKLGVSGCSSRENSDKTVRQLWLPFNDLVGVVPDEIQYLHRLESAHFQFNRGLVGSIPSGILQLDHLVDLQMQYCRLKGTIPDFTQTKDSLSVLGLGNNLMTGEIPASMAELTKLEVLGLDDNSFFGSLDTMKRMTKLRSLYLEDNSISGELSNELLDSWPVLEELDLSNCGIHSQLPSKLFSHPKLTVIDLHGNKFHGALPDAETINIELRFLALHGNQLGSTIPETISNLVELGHLDVSSNQFELPLPSSMGKMSSLRYLFAGHNHQFVDHEIPGFIEKLQKLRELSLKENQLTGTIPDWIASLKFLQLLDLDSNDLTGTIPSEIASMKGLDHLLLNRNRLSGSIPSFLAKMTDLDVVLLDANDFTGDGSPVCAQRELAFYVTDCAGSTPEVECNCCNLCCSDDNPSCNDLDWTVNLDPIWEYGFNRHVYRFGQDLLAP